MKWILIAIGVVAAAGIVVQWLHARRLREQWAKLAWLERLKRDETDEEWRDRQW
jgi:hypothetical protein